MRAFARRACIHCAAGSLRRGRSSEIEATGLGLAAEPERGLGELNPHAQTSRRQIAVNQPNRFARFSADGRLVALVADGPVPEWPADLAAVEDAQLRVLEEAYLAEFTRLEADRTPTSPNCVPWPSMSPPFVPPPPSACRAPSRRSTRPTSRNRPRR